MTEPIAVIGLGRMGQALCARLASRGVPVTGWTRSGRDPIPGVTRAATLEEAVGAADILLLSLFDDSAVREVLSRLSRLDLSGRLIVETSTIAPSVVREAAPAIEAAGGRIVDVPISGGPEMVAAGTIGLFAGGAPRDLARFAPVARLLSERFTEVGPLGSGHAAKIVNNVAMGGAFQGMIEAFQLGARLGLDLSTMLDLMENSPAAAPAFRARIPKMRGDDANVGYSVTGVLKDQALFLATADSVGASLPALAAARENFRLTAEAGHAEDDLAVVMRVRTAPDPHRTSGSSGS